VDASIEAVSLKTGVVKPVLSGGYFGRYVADGPIGHLLYVRQGVVYAVAFDAARLEVRGKPEQVLVDLAGAARTPFDFSRNGTFVYHAGAETDLTWPVMWMDSSGKEDPLVSARGNYSYPRFSPDGRRLALTADTGKGQEIFVYDLRSDVMSRLAFTAGGTAGGANLFPVWSRDGEHLVCRSRTATGSRLTWLRADGSGDMQVLLESRNLLVPSGFSPDGRRLAYQELKPEGDMDLWTLPLDSGDPEHPKPGAPAPFLRTAASEVWLVFSPDGRYVAYFSNESGTYETYVRPAPGPDGKPTPGKWQVSSGGGRYPEWSPSGHELFFEGLDSRIMVADYTDARGAFSSGKPRVWSGRQIRAVGTTLNFALAPDGNRIAMFPTPQATADRGAAQVTFLFNFFDELRRRVAVRR
jgi:hypothetical protein